MVTEKQGTCSPTGGCCCVDAMVSVDERGQMVLPKETREKAGIKAGDKLIVTGPKKLYDENAAILELEVASTSSKIAAQAKTWNTKADLLVISAADGKVIKTVSFDFAPVWDGIAVAEQALFVSGTDGVLYRLQ